VLYHYIVLLCYIIILSSDHFDEILTSSEYAVVEHEVFFLGDSQTDDVSNFIVGGYDNPQDCYITCVDKNGGRCLVFRLVYLSAIRKLSNGQCV